MMRLLMMFLLLAGVASADVPYRWKLLTAADVKAYLPKGWRLDPGLEEFETDGYRGIGQYDYKYKQVSVLYLKSAWAVRSDAAAAKREYSQIVAVQALNPLVQIDENWSNHVHVGEECSCVRLKRGRIYTLCFRKGKNVGYFTLGLQGTMSARELEGLAKTWVRRADGERPMNNPR